MSFVILPSLFLTREGIVSIALRYGSAERVWNWIDNVLPKRDGSAFPMGAASNVGSNFDEGIDIHQVMAALRTVPVSAAGPEVFARQVGPRRWESVTVPMLGDLDEHGVCRCGCGYKHAPSIVYASDIAKMVAALAENTIPPVNGQYVPVTVDGNPEPLADNSIAP